MASISRTLPLLILAVAVVASSCGVFDTRDSNPPVGNGQQTPREIPINVDAVLTNLANAVAYKDPALYDETYDDSFQFIADPADRAYFAQQGEDIFEDWNKADEIAAVRLIFSASESLTVSISERSREITETGETVRLDYRFRQRMNADSVATYRGYAEVSFIEDSSSMWSISKWEETDDTEFLTWGFVKGITSS